MSSIPKSSSSAQNQPDPGLGDLAHLVWRRRVLVIVCTVLFAALGAWLSVWNTRWLSEALLLMPASSVKGYKRYEAALFNEPRLDAFLETQGERSPRTEEVLRSLLRDRTRLSQAVRPEFAYTDRDAREFGVRIEGATPFLGVRLSLTEREPGQQSTLRVLAEYVRDTVIKLDLQARLMRWCHDYQTRELELRSSAIDAEFAMQQQRRKADELRAIVQRTPKSEAVDSRQVISLENGGERYLSPAAQIVAAEVLVTDYELAAQQRARDIVAAQVKKAYYCEASTAITQPITGRAFLESLDEMAERAFGQLPLSEDLRERVENTFKVQRTRWRNAYLDEMRFVAAPDGAQVRVRKPPLVVGIIGGAVVGALIGVLLALLRSWWRRNREAIVAERD